MRIHWRFWKRKKTIKTGLESLIGLIPMVITIGIAMNIIAEMFHVKTPAELFKELYGRKRSHYPSCFEYR